MNQDRWTDADYYNARRSLADDEYFRCLLSSDRKVEVWQAVLKAESIQWAANALQVRKWDLRCFLIENVPTSCEEETWKEALESYLQEPITYQLQLEID